MGKIKFVPQNIEREAPSHKSVLEVSLENNISIQSSCKGMVKCGECRVYLLEGENQVLPPTSKELSLIGQGYYIDRRRLACQLYCYGDVTVDLSEQIHKAENQKSSKVFLKRIHKENVEKMNSVKDSLLLEENESKKLK